MAKHHAVAGHNVEGALWMLLSVIAGAAMSVTVKQVGGDMHAVQITFLRCAVTVALVVPWVTVRARAAARRADSPYWSPFVCTSNWPLLVLRGALATVAIHLGYYALTRMPLATVTVLYFTTPLFVTLLAGPMFGERVSWRRWVATVVGFAGAVVALDPGAGSFTWIAVAPLASSALFAFSLTIGKKLSRTELPNTILLFTNGVAAAGSLVPALFVWRTPDPAMACLIVALAAFAFARTYADIRAYAAGEASFVAPFGYLRLPLLAFAGYLLFAEIPAESVYWGAAAIVSSTVYIAHREARRSRTLPGTDVGRVP